ncbi:MAG TPA: hypothetical protein VJ203_11350 [Bacteroidales bacterium]|nr:hypothetical protein [Bacteroidales bacterium]
MHDDQVVAWLLSGDVSICFQTCRDLLGAEHQDLQQKIATEGWGAGLLSLRQQNGHWGLGFYRPKWTSTHYTLLDLKNLAIEPVIPQIRETVTLITRKNKGPDGGINPSDGTRYSDVCINGMFLNYACYFGADREELRSVTDFILSQQLPDGGFNCQYNRKGAVHSSLHSTLSVAEGILEYAMNGYTYRLKEMQQAELDSREFILQHKLFQSHRTGQIIDPKMLLLSYPSRWRYDILRCLDYFRLAGMRLDNRMTPAIEILLGKKKAGDLWPLQAKHPGQTHLNMEQAGENSRWNTLRALRVLKHFDIKI